MIIISMCSNAPLAVCMNDNKHAAGRRAVCLHHVRTPTCSPWCSAREPRSASTKRSNRSKTEDRKNTTPTRRSKFDKQKAAQDDAKIAEEARQNRAEKKDDNADEDDSNSLSSI